MALKRVLNAQTPEMVKSQSVRISSQVELLPLLLVEIEPRHAYKGSNWYGMEEGYPFSRLKAVVRVRKPIPYRCSALKINRQKEDVWMNIFIVKMILRKLCEIV